MGDSYNDVRARLERRHRRLSRGALGDEEGVSDISELIQRSGSQAISIHIHTGKAKSNNASLLFFGFAIAVVVVIIMLIGPARLFALGTRSVPGIAGVSTGVCADVADSLAAGWKPEDGVLFGRTMIVPHGSRFASTGSSAWGGNPGGRHTGSDVIGRAVTPVYLPVAATLVAKGNYTDVGRFGEFRRFESGGVSFYFGHLQNAIEVPEGSRFPAGIQIGEMTGGPAGYSWGPHTHWQIERAGAVDGFGDIDPEEWWSSNCSSKAGAALSPSGDMEALVFRWADEYGVPRNLVRAVMTQESGGNPDSVSYVGAVGLMQVMPATAVGIARDLGIQSYDLSDPETNARFGVYYLSAKLERYGLVWGLAAYNWGPGSVDMFLSRHPEAANMSWDEITSQYGGEIPAETQGYVRNILAMAGES
jgi:murein DD-endopeptidase MepM/ murein hydrolase activator NlpD